VPCIFQLPTTSFCRKDIVVVPRSKVDDYTVAHYNRATKRKSEHWRDRADAAGAITIAAARPQVGDNVRIERLRRIANLQKFKTVPPASRNHLEHLGKPKRICTCKALCALCLSTF
jgi:hypothetical protein